MNQIDEVEEEYNSEDEGKTPDFLKGQERKLNGSSIKNVDNKDKESDDPDMDDTIDSTIGISVPERR